MRQIRRILPVITAISLLAACSATKPIVTDPKSSEPVPTFTEKETKYAEDDTTDVLVDAEIKPEDIVRVVKHGDHWHVFTKDGRERITYSDPTALKASQDEKEESELEFVSVIPLSKLAKLPITVIKQHGDHYHCYTADGTEYITYENPSKAFPKIKITQYVGSHGQHKHNHNSKSNNNTTTAEAEKKSQNSSEKKGSDVVKILRHGDHWHVYTRDGNEFITYSDPSGRYPNATVGIYHGTHGGSSKTPNKIMNDIQKDVENGDTTSFEHKQKVKSAIDQLDIKPVIKEGHGLVDRHDIVKILDHNNHWHIFDSHNNEGVVYVNPRNLYPNAKYFGGANPLNIKVNENDRFDPKKIAPKKIDSVLRYLDGNLRSMKEYGDISKKHTGANGNEGYFYFHDVPGAPHYHAITIDDIIIGVKSGWYGNHTAEDVVATLNWIINNHTAAEEVNKELCKEEAAKKDAVKKLVVEHYGVLPSDVEIGGEAGDYATIIIGNLRIPMADFTVTNGEAKYNNTSWPTETSLSDNAKGDNSESSDESESDDEDSKGVDFQKRVEDSVNGLLKKAGTQEHSTENENKLNDLVKNGIIHLPDNTSLEDLILDKTGEIEGFSLGNKNVSVTKEGKLIVGDKSIDLTK